MSFEMCSKHLCVVCIKLIMQAQREWFHEGRFHRNPASDTSDHVKKLPWRKLGTSPIPTSLPDLNNVVWIFWRSRLRVARLIFAQISGFTFVPSSFSQFLGLVYCVSFSFNLSSASIDRAIFLQWRHAFHLPEVHTAPPDRTTGRPLYVFVV